MTDNVLIDRRRCRGCDLPNPDAKYTSYWGWQTIRVHEACKQKTYTDEAYECQLIDADCNDCKNFKRGEMKGKDKFSRIWNGHCLKFDKPTIAYPMMATGRDCFEHRRAK